MSVEKGVLRRAARPISGFTLIELLVVVFILGVLSAIAIPSYLSAVQQSKLSTANSNTYAISVEVQALYVQDHGRSYAAVIGSGGFTGAYAAMAAKDLGGAVPVNPCTGGRAFGPDYSVSNAGNAQTGVTIAAVAGTCNGVPKSYRLGTG